jgi:Ca2+-binding RTX toxin-like protein
VFPIGDETAGHGYESSGPTKAPLILASDRDFGLYILRYTGSAGKCGKQEVTMLGTEGKDNLKGTPGKDVINALGGNDRVNGLGGNDRLCGGKGKDKLKGGPGKDLLIGGPQRDVCNGGPGRDKAKSCEKEKNIP